MKSTYIHVRIAFSEEINDLEAGNSAINRSFLDLFHALLIFARSGG